MRYGVGSRLRPVTTLDSTRKARNSSPRSTASTRERSTAMTALKIAGAFLGIAVVFSVGGSWFLRRGYEFRHFQAVEPGMTRAQVVEQLGSPDVEYTKESAPKDYFVPGFDSKERQISGSVLIYRRSYAIAYAYLSEAGSVEEVFIGGS
jgi:hypothetical protein